MRASLTAFRVSTSKCLVLGNRLSNSGGSSGHLSSRRLLINPCKHHFHDSNRLNWFQRDVSQVSLERQVRSFVVSRAVASEEVAREVEQGELSSSTLSKDNTVILDVEKMKCGGCSAAVKKVLEQQDKVIQASVNLITGSAVINIKDGSTKEDVEQIINAVNQKGFPTSLRRENSGNEILSKSKIEEARDEKFALQFAWLLALTCYGHHLGHFLHIIGLHEYAHSDWMSWIGNPFVGGVLGAMAILGPGRSLIIDGFLSFFRGAPNMNSLIALGATTSFSAGTLSALLPNLTIDSSFLEEPVMLLAFVLLGRSLEKRARNEASGDLASLAKLIPSSSRLVTQNDESMMDTNIETVSIATSLVRTGDVLQVYPGETIPVDGVIIRGSCSVDESLLTGESRTVYKEVDNSVTGGTILYDSPILLKATSTGDSSILSKIAQMVKDAQSREAPVQRLADKVAGWFCYTVMSASISAFAFWSVFGINWYPNVLYNDALSNLDSNGILLSLKLAIDVLVVACPCALGLATPTAVLVASSSAAKKGLLVRGGDVLESLANISTVVFDKTGTITTGNISLANVEVFQGSRRETIRLAATAESQTIHPLAKSLLSAAQQEGLTLGALSNSKNEPGNGVSAEIDGDIVFVGRKNWVYSAIGDRLGQESTSDDGSLTRVWVGTKMRGMIARLDFSDCVRSESQAVVKHLKAHGKKVILLSGDEAGISRRIGADVGIPAEQIFGGQSPASKATFVQSLRRQGETVAMVGDGVNDAVALSAANVGVAMGNGTDAAGSAADVILLGNNLTQFAEAMQIGEATLTKIKQNLFLALVYNAIGIPIAAGVLLPKYGIMLSPSFAAAMMACSSIIVVSNSLLLKKKSTGMSL